MLPTTYTPAASRKMMAQLWVLASLNPLALLIWHTASSPCTLDEEPTRCMLLSSQGGEGCYPGPISRTRLQSSMISRPVTVQNPYIRAAFGDSRTNVPHIGPSTMLWDEDESYGVG